MNKCEEPISDSDSPDSDHEGKPTSSFLLSNAAQPKFEITTKRKFEISELCEIFVHRYVKYAYLVLLSIYSFMAAWSFSTVAGSAWAVNIPFQNFGGAEKCEQDAFLHNLLPHGGCLYAYYFCLFLFAIIVVTLSMFDLKEQAMVQLVLGLLRFITVGIIVLFCIVRLIQGGDACMEELHITNRTTPVNIGMRFTVFRFDPKGWVLGIPLFTYAFLFHTGISTLTHPIKQKAYLHWLLVAMFLAALLSYAALGVVVPLWFRASIQETCTLNWVSVAVLCGIAGLVQIFSCFHYLYNPFQLAWNMAGKKRISLQINHTHCVGPAYPLFRSICGHYLPLSSCAQMFQVS